MDQQKRLLLAIGLSFGLTLIFTNFVWKPQQEEAARLAMAFDGGEAIIVDAGGDEVMQAAVLDAGVAEVPQVAAAPASLPQRTLTATRATTRMAFTTEGAGLVDATLLGEREHLPQQLSIPDGFKKLLGGTFAKPPQVNLAESVPGGAPQLAVSITGATPLSPITRYAVKEEADGRLVFTTVSGPWEVTKTFTWAQGAIAQGSDPAGYLSTMDIAVKNVSSNPVGGDLLVHANKAIDPQLEQAPSMFGGIGNQASVLCRVVDDVKRKVPPAEGGGFGCGGSPVYDLEEKGPIHFIGIDQQYFLTAVWPKDGAIEGKCQLNATQTSRVASLAMPLTLQPGQTMTKSFGVFLGPKDLELLSSVSKGAAQKFDPGLEKTVDFGWWAVIARFLVIFLRFFHGLVGNWGIAIIALTVAVKLVLLPLTHRAMVSAEQMKKLQPKMEDIRKKYPEDREKQNLEMMKLYQEAKVNPLGGCLPLLLQLPIWGALFTTLRTSYELYGQPFAVWGDLTSKDPTYLLPLALGITMIVTQRLQPQMTMDKSQAFMMTWVMPVFFTAVMMNYPSGLALYIFTNNLLSIVQQYALRRWLQRTGQAAAPAKGAAR